MKLTAVQIKTLITNFFFHCRKAKLSQSLLSYFPLCPLIKRPFSSCKCDSTWSYIHRGVGGCRTRIEVGPLSPLCTLSVSRHFCRLVPKGSTHISQHCDVKYVAGDALEKKDGKKKNGKQARTGEENNLKVRKKKKKLHERFFLLHSLF